MIQKYLEAETSVAEERELAKSDKNVGLLSEALAADEYAPLPDAGEEFDRIVRSARRRTFRHWSYAISGIAAILVAVLFLTRKPMKVLEILPEANDNKLIINKNEQTSTRKNDPHPPLDMPDPGG